MGLGCKSPQEKLEERLRNANIISSETAIQDEGPLVYPEPEPIDDTPNPSPDIIYLREVMRNLSQAETFRAKVGVPVQGGEADISVDFNKSIGMYGRMRIDIDNELTISDVFLSDDEIHFRANTGTWTNITGTEQAQVLQALFRHATLPNSGAENFVSKYAEMQEKTSNESGCELYAFKQYNELRARVELFQICVKNSFPVYIVTESPFGSQRIEYSDVNGFVDVQKP